MPIFGEIVEPSSRTTWEDWDDDFQEQNLSELRWQNAIEGPNGIDQFFIFEGTYLSNCIRSKARDLEYINTIPDVNLHLFKGSNKYICTINNYELIQSSEVIELLKPYLIASKEVVVIQIKSISEFNITTLTTEDCVIRTVCTTKPSKLLDIKLIQLEQPNIVSGVLAGVISLREHLDQPAIAIVCYVEYSEEYQIKEVQKLLEKFDILQDIKPRENSILNTNLYI